MGSEQRQRTEKPEVTDEHKDKAKEMAKAYDDDLQTTSMPGTGGTVSGTAVTEWVDDKDKGNSSWGAKVTTTVTTMFKRH